MLWFLLLVGCADPEPPLPPMADFDVQYNCALVPDATFVGDASVPGDAPITDWFWEFGHNDTAGVGPLVDHRFPKSAVYDVRLTVVDDDGLADDVVRSIDAWHCLEVDDSVVYTDGAVAWGRVSVSNVSGYDDAAPSFHMALLDDNGMARFTGLDAGQHRIDDGDCVTFESEKIACAPDCGDLVGVSLSVVWDGWLPD